MKEPIIEQKAKRYDEAKSIMEKYLKSGNVGVIAENTIKKAFPELAEPEDERIRKAMIDYFRWNPDGHLLNEFSNREILTWLEKQGEQKPTDEELAQAKRDAYNDALDKIEYHSEEPTFDDGWSAAIWYLKKKNVQLQSQWKPSDEQMDALRYVTNFDYGGYKAALVSLYEQLKKL